MQNTSNTSQSTPSVDTPDIRCAGCPALLTTEEVYCCAACVDAWAEADPNFDMTGDDNG